MSTTLADDIHLVSEGNRQSLRSSSDNMCAVPRTHNSFGDRSFGAVGPRIWNSLPRGLRTLDISYKHFKALLKTYMFRQGHGALSALEIFLLTSSSVWLVLPYLSHRIGKTSEGFRGVGADSIAQISTLLSATQLAFFQSIPRGQSPWSHFECRTWHTGHLVSVTHKISASDASQTLVEAERCG